MIPWIIENAGTIIISLILVAIVTGVIISIIGDKKMGRTTCGGSCASCKMCAACRQAGRK